MKATKTEIEQRVSEVLAIRLDGAEFHDIVQYAAEKQWGVGERQLWNYVQAADELLVTRLEKDRDKLFARHVAQRRNLYARAVNAADYGNASRILKDEAELLNLYPAKKLEVGGKGGAPVQLHIVEEIIGPAAAALNVEEEIVTHDGDSDPAGTSPRQEGAPAPGPAGVPTQ